MAFISSAEDVQNACTFYPPRLTYLVISPAVLEAHTVRSEAAWHESLMSLDQKVGSAAHRP